MVLIASCSPTTEKKVNKPDAADTKKADTTSAHIPAENTLQKPEMPADFSELVPIDVLNSKSTNVYEKYGIEFSGNCYSCDLASLSITKDKIIWKNVCDKKDTFTMDDFSFSNEGNKTMIKTSERTYIITQLDKAPVYEVIIEGKKTELHNKRVSKYFTTPKALSLFTEHNCGDFEG